MEIYKRNYWSLIKSLVIAAVTPVFLIFIIGIFTENELLIYGISGAAGVILLISALFFENIKFELNDGRLLYFVRNRLKGDYDLRNCYVGCKIKSEGNGVMNSYDMTLFILRAGEENEDEIDCKPLGINKFNHLYASINTYCLKPENKIKTKKKEE